MGDVTRLPGFDLSAVLEAIEAAIPSVPSAHHALILASFAAVLRDDVEVPV